MKRIITFVLIAIVALSSVGCSKTGAKASGSITTLDATSISADQFTFNVEYTYNGGSGSVAQVGVYYGPLSTQTEETHGMSSSYKYITKSEKDTYSVQTSNIFTEIFSIKTYYVSPGSTCYYRAYMHIIDGETTTTIYGETKSFVVPEAK